MQTTTLEERLRAAAGSTSAVPPARDVAGATTASLDGAASVKDKVWDENGIEEGTLEKGTKRYGHPWATRAATGRRNTRL